MLRKQRGLFRLARDPSASLRISAAGSRFAHARKAPQVKPRRADCTARESVWESRSLPALVKAVERNLDGLFLFDVERYAGEGVEPWQILIGCTVRRWRVF